jgi:hypothetical protein
MATHRATATARVARQSGPDQLDRSGVLLAGETLHHVVASLMTILIPKPRGQAKSALSSPPKVPLDQWGDAYVRRPDDVKVVLTFADA